MSLLATIAVVAWTAAVAVTLLLMAAAQRVSRGDQEDDAEG